MRMIDDGEEEARAMRRRSRSDICIWRGVGEPCQPARHPRRLQIDSNRGVKYTICLSFISIFCSILVSFESIFQDFAIKIEQRKIFAVIK